MISRWDIQARTYVSSSIVRASHERELLCLSPNFCQNVTRDGESGAILWLDLIGSTINEIYEFCETKTWNVSDGVTYL